ncbi:MAG: bifunctional diaminohydroxyphosphoribosylaminopyrimidine deaminase/5-amino-6-(5-phosphoribosylamino)uracil reductase RibD [Aquificae bacterium]|nr:bifunctional diaminohydroxyphosphoribosylaminopyrimidine deaminase/5-amino-6-(5-phosphoribosylamino)uracil reductase RibD [Aquificota bacterium]
MRDEEFMKRALELAKSRKGYTHPNPTVGAIVVKEGKVVSEGVHERAGSPHAEVVAIERAGQKARGATLYVTLEPCSHWGRTPPCTDLIIRSGISRVVVATTDPNPLVSGKGIKKLKESGIEVEVGVLEEEAKELNEDFFTYITQKRPYVTLKWAQSADGKLATLSGSSKWLTSPESRKRAHELRREASAVLVGVNTVIRDDPLLTVRLVPSERQPVRIVIDPSLRIPLDAKLVRNKEAPTWVITKEGGKKKKELEKLGVEVFVLDDLSVKNILKVLYEKEIMHLLVEGGARTLSHFLKEGIFDRVCVFTAPKLMGEGLSVGGRKPGDVSELLELKLRRLERIGDDIFALYKRPQAT